MENNFNVSARLERKKFDFFDSSFSCVAFIVLLLVARIFVRFFWTKSTQEYLAHYSVALYLLAYILISVLVEAVFFFAGLISAKNRNIEYFKATTFNKMPNGKTMIFALIVAIVSIFAFSGLTNVFVISLQKLGYTTSLNGISIPNFGIYIMYVFIVCIVPAICEESLFRGVILNGFKGMGKHFAVFMSALIFMLMHGGPEQTVHQFILGVILGYVLVYSGSIWVTIFIHFLNNFISVTMIYITNSGAAQTAEAATELPSWGNLAISLVYSLALAALGAYLIYVCIKQMKLSQDEKNEKNKNSILHLLEKEELSQQEIADLKELTQSVQEYEELSDKNADESATQTGVDEVVASEDVQKSVDKNKKKMVSIPSLILLIASLTYLTIDWLISLIGGFMK